MTTRRQNNKVKDTYNRSRMMITEYVVNTCTKMYNENMLMPDSGKHGFICNYLGTIKIPKGSLCRLDCAPHSKYYLSWYLGEDNGEHYLQSIEDHSVVRASNVAVCPLPIELTKDAFQFHYSDRQFEFQDRWEKVVKKKSYWLVPMYSVFDEETERVLVRFRRKFDDYVFMHEFPSWVNTSNKELEQIIDKLIEEEDNHE